MLIAAVPSLFPLHITSVSVKSISIESGASTCIFQIPEQFDASNTIKSYTPSGSCKGVLGALYWAAFTKIFPSESIKVFE